MGGVRGGRWEVGAKACAQQPSPGGMGLARGALAPCLRPGRSGEFPGAPFLSPEPGRGGAGWGFSGCKSAGTARARRPGPDQASRPKGGSSQSPRPACHSPSPRAVRGAGLRDPLPPRPLPPSTLPPSHPPGAAVPGGGGLGVQFRLPPSRVRPGTRGRGLSTQRPGAQRNWEGAGLPSHWERGHWATHPKPQTRLLPGRRLEAGPGPGKATGCRVEAQPPGGGTSGRRGRDRGRTGADQGQRPESCPAHLPSTCGGGRPSGSPDRTGPWGAPLPCCTLLQQ